MSFFSKKTDQSYFDAFKEKLNQYKDSDLASEWLDKNKKRVQALFENHRLRDFILEPFKNVFTSPPKEMDHHIWFDNSGGYRQRRLAGLPTAWA